jgi:hypothetical protein
MRETILRLLHLTILAALACSAASPARARQQDGKGPLPPPPKFEVKRIPAEPHPGPPPVPEAEIIKRFAANEDVMRKMYETYTFTQAIRIEEPPDPGGKFTVTGDVYTKPDGERWFHVTKPVQSNLKTIYLTLDDVRSIISFPLFVLTTEEVGNYDFKYAGQDKLDDINTYVFQVTPKELSRKRRFFKGVVWVDDRDFVIVKSYGEFVSEISRRGTTLPFSIFETFRENFQDKYWLPTYTRSDDFIRGGPEGDIRLHLVVRDTDLKLQEPPAAASPEPAPNLGSPKSN